MPPYTSPILRVRLSALGEDLNSWGEPNLNNAFYRIEEAIGSIYTLTITGDRTLTADNYIANEYRRHTQVLTGSPAADFTLTVPPISYPYRIVNRTGRQATIKTASGASAIVRVGATTTVLCDGTDCTALDPTLDQIKTAAGPVNAGGQKFTNLADGTQVGESVHYGQLAPFTLTAQRWATQTTGTVVDAVTGVDSGTYSAKEFAQGTQSNTGGSAKSWATSTAIVAGGFKGAYGYAQDASGSATSAASSFSNFDKRYLGAKSADPALDNQGAPLVVGALYFNSVANEMRSWNGSVWGAAYIPGSSVVSGPASATADAIALFNGTNGKIIKDSGLKISDLSSFTGQFSQSANYTVASADKGKIITLVGSATLTLPPPTAGFYIWVQKSDRVGKWLISSGGAPTIDGLSAITCYQESFGIVSDGTNWFTVGRPKGWIDVAFVSLTGQLLSSALITAGFSDAEIPRVDIAYSNLTFGGVSTPNYRVQKNGSLINGSSYNYTFNVTPSTGTTTSGASALCHTSTATIGWAGELHCFDVNAASGTQQVVRMTAYTSSFGAGSGNFVETTNGAMQGISIFGSNSITALNYTVRGFRP